MFLDVFWMFLLHTSHSFGALSKSSGSSFRAMPAPVVEETPGVASCWIHALMVRGFTIQQLRVAGFELSALRAFGFTPKRWRSWDVPNSQLESFSQGWHFHNFSSCGALASQPTTFSGPLYSWGVSSEGIHTSRSGGRRANGSAFAGA